MLPKPCALCPSLLCCPHDPGSRDHRKKAWGHRVLSQGSFYLVRKSFPAASSQLALRGQNWLSVHGCTRFCEGGTLPAGAGAGAHLPSRICSAPSFSPKNWSPGVLESGGRAEHWTVPTRHVVFEGPGISFQVEVSLRQWRCGSGAQEGGRSEPLSLWDVVVSSGLTGRLPPGCTL